MPTIRTESRVMDIDMKMYSAARSLSPTINLTDASAIERVNKGVAKLITVNDISVSPYSPALINAVYNGTKTNVISLVATALMKNSKELTASCLYLLIKQ